MSLKHAILGLLEVTPMSGYDLKKYFNSSVNSYWAATHSQIYKTLEEITRADLAHIQTIHQDKSPSKKIYTLSDKGKIELLSWLQLPKDIPSIRHQILLQFSLAQLLTKEQIILFLGDYSFKLKEKLKTLTSLDHRSVMQYARNAKERLLWELTLKNGIMYYTNEIEWTKYSLNKIKKELQ